MVRIMTNIANLSLFVSISSTHVGTATNGDEGWMPELLVRSLSPSASP
jgi:hypothetical protein